jgi:hypothetical protein
LASGREDKIGALPFHLAMSRVPPTTPLRRTSHASLYALARSGGASSAPPDASAPASLAFLAPALAQLADEADALAGNVAATAAATDALERFNDGFGAFLYVLRMNAFTTYWPQVRGVRVCVWARELRGAGAHRAVT